MVWRRLAAAFGAVRVLLVVLVVLVAEAFGAVRVVRGVLAVAVLGYLGRDASAMSRTP